MKKLTTLSAAVLMLAGCVTTEPGDVPNFIHESNKHLSQCQGPEPSVMVYNCRVKTILWMRDKFPSLSQTPQAKIYLRAVYDQLRDDRQTLKDLGIIN